MSNHAADIDRFVLELVCEGRIPSSSPHECPYLLGRTAVEEGFRAERLLPDTYHTLMNLGFRRSGTIFYRPRCPDCSLCLQLRVPVDSFAPTRSQRRTVHRNQDLRIHVAAPELSEEKHQLYCQYLTSQHPESRQGGDADSLKEFLYTSAVQTFEVCYFADDTRLIGVSLIDVSRESISSVYHYFHPDDRRRGLGVFSVLREIALARELGVPYYYLGYWVAGAPTMDYKARYRPHELLLEGVWTPAELPLG